MDLVDQKLCLQLKNHYPIGWQQIRSKELVNVMI